MIFPYHNYKNIRIFTMDKIKKSIFDLFEAKEAILCGRKRFIYEILYAGVTGALASLIFEGVSLSFLSLFLLIPLYFFLEKCTWKMGSFRGFLWGYFWHLCAFFWLREIAWVLPFVLAAVLGSFNGIFGGLFVFYRKYFLLPKEILLEEAEKRNAFCDFSFWRRFFFPLAPSALFTLLECVRSNIFTGLPWNLLGASLWKYPVLIQIAEYTSIYGLTFLLLLYNTALFETALQFSLAPATLRWKNILKKLSPAFLYILPLTLLLILYGENTIRRKQTEEKGKDVNILRAGVIQPNLSQRRHGGVKKADEALDVCITLSRTLLEECRKKGEMPHLVIWPETAVPYIYNSISDGSTRFRKEVAELIFEFDTPFLIGAIFLTPNPADPRKLPPLVFNSALLLESGKMPSVYSKVHIVPFGEFVPFGDKFPILNRVVGMGRNLTPGSSFNPLIPGGNNDRFRIGVAICYEDIFPYITSSHAANGANLLLTITNDAWYPTSFEPRQHFANSIFRAVENNMPLLRVGNMDYSCWIASDGRVGDSLFHTEDGKADPGIRKRGCGVIRVPVRKHVPCNHHLRNSNLFILLLVLLALPGFSMAFLTFYRVRRSLYCLIKGEKEEKYE